MALESYQYSRWFKRGNFRETMYTNIWAESWEKWPKCSMVCVPSNMLAQLFRAPDLPLFVRSFLYCSLYEPCHEKNLIMPYANNNGADQPPHPHSLISALVVHCLDSTTPLVFIFKISRLCGSCDKTARMCWFLWDFTVPIHDKYPVHISWLVYIWAASSEFGSYRLCEQRRFRRACASAQSRQNLRCSLIQTVSQEEPSDRKPDPWPLLMAGHAQLRVVMTECSKTNSLDAPHLVGLGHFSSQTHRGEKQNQFFIIWTSSRENRSSGFATR